MRRVGASPPSPTIALNFLYICVCVYISSTCPMIPYIHASFTALRACAHTLKPAFNTSSKVTTSRLFYLYLENTYPLPPTILVLTVKCCQRLLIGTVLHMAIPALDNAHDCALAERLLFRTSFRVYEYQPQLEGSLPLTQIA